MPDICSLAITAGSTYGTSTTDRLLRVRQTEQPYSQVAEVIIQNASGNLTALSLEGLTGTLSWDGTATAPLKVKAQELFSAQGVLACQLILYGTPDQFNDDEASSPYAAPSTDTQTIQ